jgi:putative N6-adenine-specific DNA methylase
MKDDGSSLPWAEDTVRVRAMPRTVALRSCVPSHPSLTCWAVTTPGLEPLAVAELDELGLTPTAVEPGGVAFGASAATLADALLRLGTVNRITVRLASFRASSFGELERKAAHIEWGNVIPHAGAVHFRVTSKKSRLYHQDGIAERLERAVAQALPSVRPVRAPSEAEHLERDLTHLPEVQRIVVRVFRDEFTLSADAAGALLHFRGWRQAVAKAPLRETLAVALLRAGGWWEAARAGAPPPLVDPFCGSGTIPIEAALLARRMAPGRLRRFAAEAWPSLPAECFAEARNRARARELPVSGAEISGCDRDEGAITASRANAERAGVGEDVAFTRATVSELGRDDGTGWLVTNPPYGARIGERRALRNLYAAIGKVINERRPGWELAMLSGDRMLEQQLGTELTEVLRTTNGGIPVRVVRRKT